MIVRLSLTSMSATEGVRFVRYQRARARCSATEDRVPKAIHHERLDPLALAVAEHLVAGPLIGAGGVVGDLPQRGKPLALLGRAAGLAGALGLRRMQGRVGARAGGQGDRPRHPAHPLGRVGRVADQRHPAPRKALCYELTELAGELDLARPLGVGPLRLNVAGGLATAPGGAAKASFKRRLIRLIINSSMFI